MRDQILKLHTLPEAEQVEWLKKNGVLQTAPIWPNRKDSDYRYETLPELAFRLRDEAVQCSWVDWQYQSAVVLDGDRGHFKNLYSPGYFGNHAQPIHWIQAALLTQEERKEQ